MSRLKAGDTVRLTAEFFGQKPSVDTYGVGNADGEIVDVKAEICMVKWAAHGRPRIVHEYWLELVKAAPDVPATTPTPDKETTKRKIRFLYDGSWTKWYDIDTAYFAFLLDGVGIQAVETSELMPKAQALEYLKQFERPDDEIT